MVFVLFCSVLESQSTSSDLTFRIVSLAVFNILGAFCVNAGLRCTETGMRWRMNFHQLPADDHQAAVGCPLRSVHRRFGPTPFSTDALRPGRTSTRLPTQTSGLAFSCSDRRSSNARFHLHGKLDRGSICVPSNRVLFPFISGGSVIPLAVGFLCWCRFSPAVVNCFSAVILNSIKAIGK